MPDNCTRTNARPCYEISQRDECLKTKDSRDAPFNSDCVWCPNGPCYPGGSKCEPKDWLISSKSRKDGFEHCYGAVGKY